MKARFYEVRRGARVVFWVVVNVGAAFLFWLATAPPRW